ncbi:MAG: hypothetical protein GYB33_11210 [Gammaproteobacteria bacterium]|nr:hypothetical protein [Gammaproteobacteria bacterium]
MLTKQELVLFIPGLGAKERDEYSAKLANGLSDYCAHNGLTCEVRDESIIDGSISRQIEIDSLQKTLDIREVFWSDLVTPLSSESISIKIIRGFSLLWYWVFSFDVWQVIKHSKYILSSTIFTIIVVLFWYYGAITTALNAIAENPYFFGLPLPNRVSEVFGYLEGKLSGWNVWVGASILLAALPVTKILDISYFTKAYLQNRDSLHHKINGRLSKAIHSANSLEKKYDRITIVAHSFGVVVSTELLSQFSAQGKRNFRFITLGGPLLVAAAKESRVKQAIDNLVVNKDLESWDDFYSNQDWLCTSSPVSDKASKYTSYLITSTVSFDNRIKGASHDLYFQDRDVMKAIIGSSKKIQPASFVGG